MTAKKRSATAKKSASKKTSSTKAKSSTRKKVVSGAKSGGAKSLKKGDHVKWTTSQGVTEGVIEKKLVTPAAIKKHKVAASPDNPEYLVRSTKSGKPAAHKAESLKKTS